jgi:serine/threonine protein kinase
LVFVAKMLDCIEAFHRHGYVHRDVKASNFALSRVDKPTRPQRYYIIDFGLSRQHLDENKKVIPARTSAEFRGTSMYASLSSHRRQELGPKDDLWSWFYLVMDFMRGELPWASDAQLKNRSIVLGLKEFYTEQKPGLLIEGLQGAPHLLDMMKYLQSLRYEDSPDYKRLASSLQKVLSDSTEEEENEQDQQQEVQEVSEQVDASKVAEECDAFESERERATLWVQKAHEALDAAVSQPVIDGLLEVRR